MPNLSAKNSRKKMQEGITLGEECGSENVLKLINL